MVSCACCGCSQTPTTRSKGITFHHFPKNPSQRQLWCNLVNKQNWTPKSSSVLCSQHFADECFDQTSQLKVRLQPGALPTFEISRLKYVRIFNPPQKRPLQDTNTGDSKPAKVQKTCEAEESDNVFEPAQGSSSMLSTKESTPPRMKKMSFSEGYKNSGNIYRCMNCPYWSSSLYWIRSHLRSRCRNQQEFTCGKNNIEPYYCESCHSETQELVVLKKHKNYDKFCRTMEQNVEEYKCHYCPFKSYSVMVLVLHMRNSCVEANNSCNFKSGTDLQLKIQKDTNPDGVSVWLSCEYCSYKTKTKFDLKKHMVCMHTNEDQIEWFECAQCNYKGKQKRFLREHIKRKHTNTVDKIHWNECNYCSYKTKRKSYLNLHIEWKHTSESEIEWFRCGYCSFMSKYKESLKMHLLHKHTGGNTI